ncbi:MAG TPA: cytochrome P450 [Allosphingosinicella sp.]|nr:cytochrome P450 [Allosphingosinicella sp.]
MTRQIFADDITTAELAEARASAWCMRSSRGLEVLRYRQGSELLRHPGLQKGASFRRRLDDIGIVSGEIRDHWNRMLVCNEGDVRERLRKPLTHLFRPAQMAKLQGEVRAIVDEALDTVEDPRDVDFMREIAWKIPPRVYCHLVSAPPELAPLAAHLSDSTLAPILTVAKDRIQESVDAFMESYAFVEEHIDARRKDLGDDFTSVMIRQHLDGLLTHEELVYEGVSILQASIDNTVHQLGLTFGTLLEAPERWRRVVEQPSILPAAVEETFRLRPRFGTVFRYAEHALTYEGEAIPEDSWVFVSVRSANRDADLFDDPDSFRIGRPPVKALMFGNGPYNCLGQTLARLEIHEAIRAVIARFPDTRMLGGWRSKDTNAVSETGHLRVSLHA